jgi:primosomal protein N' (replication factor Y)
MGDFDYAKTRSVIQVLDVAPMLQSMQNFLRRVADYTLTPMPKMLRLATRAPGLGDPTSMRHVYRIGDVAVTRMTDARQRVLALFEEFPEQ